MPAPIAPPAPWPRTIDPFASWPAGSATLGRHAARASNSTAALDPRTPTPRSPVGCAVGWATLALSAWLAGCATGGAGGDGRPPAMPAGGTASPAATVPPSAAGGSAEPLQESAECKAARLKPADPMPASALTPEMLRQARSGYVSMRYDVVRGRAEHVQVVLSNPPGLYDGIAVRHAQGYRDPGGGSARGCLMTVNVQF